MAKTNNNTTFFCKECGYESAKWLGQCPGCREWNTFVEAPKAEQKHAGVRRAGLNGGQLLPVDIKASTMSEIDVIEEERIETGISEFDRVLGGGIIKGSLILVGGDPGIGKSTILTQVCRNLSCKGHSVLYISGEESLGQIKLRAGRLGEFTDNMKLLSETDLDQIEGIISREKPEVCVIDSIQTMYRKDVSSAPGSIGQVKECTNILMQLAKGLNVAVFVIGHVTKEGVVAGPRMLEHMVDTVLYFEGDKSAAYRILRGVKNRFGSTNEIGVFEMCSSGLREVENPSEYMLVGRPVNVSGSVVSCSLEGTRPILVEIQALVSKSALGNPRRSSTGIDYNRMNLLLAVLEKRLGFNFSECDAYVNVVGGLRVTETALDLSVVLALASSYMDFVIPEDVLVFGEVGLSGEVRNVSMFEARIREAKKLGFRHIVVPGFQTTDPEDGIIPVGNIREAILVLKNGNF